MRDSTDPNDRSAVADTGTSGVDTSGMGNATQDDTDAELVDAGAELLDALEEGARALAKKRRAPGSGVLNALERILSHAEGHGEAYRGAITDHTTVRAFMTDQYAK